MPRGLLPTGMVAITELFKPSMTVTSPDFSLLTQTQKGLGAVSAAKERGARPIKARARSEERDNAVFMKKTINDQPSTLNTQRSTHNDQHSTLNTQRSTLNAQHSTLNTQRSTLNAQHSRFN